MHDVLLPSSKVRRLHNSVRLPQEAAVAARLPVIGRRVPLRGYWARRPVHTRALLGELWQRRHGVPLLPHISVQDGLAATESIVADAGRRATPVLDPMTAAVRNGADRAAVRWRHIHVPEGVRKRLRGGVWRFGAVAAASMAFMYYADPVSGRRRRAIVRDRVSRAGHAAGRVPARVEKRGRFARGVARGIVHGTRTLFGADGHGDAADEEMLVARVRSEMFRDTGTRPGGINIDAYEGCVTLRGQLSSESEIRRLIAAAKAIEGVRSVRSYLHLPDELPPNKAQMYEQSEQHLPSM